MNPVVEKRAIGGVLLPVLAEPNRSREDPSGTDSSAGKALETLADRLRTRNGMEG